MLTIKDDIYMLRKSIEQRKSELELLDPKNPDNRFKYANLKSEIEHDRRKLERLEAEEYAETMKNAPQKGDSKCSNFPHENALYDLRIKHFKLFGTDPSISYSGEGTMFGDYSLSAYSDFYNVDGTISFRLVYSSYNARVEKDINASVGITLSKGDFLKADEEQIKFLVSYIKDYSSNPVNFILTDGRLNEVTFVRIASKEFNHTTDNKRDYRLFFSQLFDAMYRNIIYIGDTMKDGATSDDTEEVQIKYIDHAHTRIAKEQGITSTDLKRQNDEICEKILKFN